ncbi:cytochrome c1 [Rhodovibrio sodomensis]|uniref:Cytochrome c1 n=1 Tax=Rhodovibrio sodomensis TaxID=1088 RepID=A0ABS1DHB6_9PROT|nr:cytochrome c1 [Rhodovibrio sodomensis]MBK1668780.1 cytochrome c1 [Rhodovibrio sodomensis]
MKKLFAALAMAATMGLASGPAHAAEATPIPEHTWQFEGIFGTFNRASAQRGLQVYNQVCSSCHGMKYVAFRTLKDLGYSEDQVEAIAAQYTVTAGPNDQGEMYQRPAEPTDTFPSPYANRQVAMNANNGVYPPDLSVITNARPGGAEYIRALLIGYKEPPADANMSPGQYWNKYFPGHKIAMPQMLVDGAVDYQDGTQATASQMAHDVTTFLHWASNPHMEERKRMGIKVILFLIVLTGLLYAVQRKVWSDVKK